MSGRLLVAGLIVLAGCLSTRYPCDTDLDCTGGDGGRCEAGGACSFLDPSCASGRRFAEHTGDVANTCTEPRNLNNACVAGEPWPTIGDPCAAVVCPLLPACCDVMWGEACVHLADQLCDAHCGRWIATSGPAQSDLIAWTGTDYAARGQVAGVSTRVAWGDARQGRPHLILGREGAIAELEPTGTELAPTFAATRQLTGSIGSQIRGITSVDTDGDAVVELGLAFFGTAPHLVVVDAAGTPRTVPSVPEVESLAWADYTGDGNADLVIGTATDYRLLYWSPPDLRYEIAFVNIQTAGAFPSVAWGDVDGDGNLDLVAIGAAVAVHLGDGLAISVIATAIMRPPGSTSSVGAVGDLDGDHRADIVVANTAGTTMIVYTWDEMTDELRGAQTLTTAGMQQLALADVDDDGKLDVIGAAAMGGLVWSRNTSSGGVISLDPATPIAAASTATWFAVTGWPAE